MQNALYERAKRFLNAKTSSATDINTLSEIVDSQGGFVFAPWCGYVQCENMVQGQTKATVRCIPFDAKENPPDANCIACGKPAKWIVPFAKAY